MMDPAGSGPAIINIAVTEIDSLQGANDVVIQNNRMCLSISTCQAISFACNHYKFIPDAVQFEDTLSGNARILILK